MGLSVGLRKRHWKGIMGEKDRHRDETEGYLGISDLGVGV
jgi:hypothetical protein